MVARLSEKSIAHKAKARLEFIVNDLIIIRPPRKIGGILNFQFSIFNFLAGGKSPEWIAILLAAKN
jgi:hypothetical protein